MIASIIITNYNYEKFLGRCIRSCLNQIISEKYEVILVDDCSKDKSLKIASEFKHFNNFKIIQNKKNMGVAASANSGFRKAKGKYIVRIDADDYVSKNFLFFLTYYLKLNPNKLGVASDYVLINNNEKIIKREFAIKKPIACAILYDKNKLKKFGYYNKNFRHREEEELRARIGENYEIGYIGIPLYRYRMHINNKTKSKDYKFNFKEKIEKIQLNNIFKKTIQNKKLKKKIVAIIPARSGSKRLKNKNIKSVLGQPMITWVINAAKNSKFVSDIYVTSDSKKILNISKKYKVKTILRPIKLAGDQIPKIEAIRHAVNVINKKQKIDIVVSLQANSPNIRSIDIDKCISDLILKKKDEVVSVDNELNQNGAIRVMKKKTVFNTFLSTHFSCTINNAMDIHIQKDITKTIKIMR